MTAADFVFATPELRGAIMAERAKGMAREHVRSLRVCKGAAPGMHQLSVRCAAYVRCNGRLVQCTENVRRAAVAHGRVVCNRCLPHAAGKLHGSARWAHVDFMLLAERRDLAVAFWRAH